MAKAKTVAETVDMPEGLDVIPTVPAPTSAATTSRAPTASARTDRPGEILGTPAQLDPGTAKHQARGP